MMTIDLSTSMLPAFHINTVKNNLLSEESCRWFNLKRNSTNKMSCFLLSFAALIRASPLGAVIFAYSKCVYKIDTDTQFMTANSAKIGVLCFKREARDTDQYLNMMERCLLTTVNTGLWK